MMDVNCENVLKYQTNSGKCFQTHYLPHTPKLQLSPEQCKPFGFELLSAEGLSNEITNQISQYREVEFCFKFKNNTHSHFHLEAKKLFSSIEPARRCK